jgi:hypothetical protein
LNVRFATLWSTTARPTRICTFWAVPPLQLVDVATPFARQRRFVMTIGVVSAAKLALS